MCSFSLGAVRKSCLLHSFALACALSQSLFAARVCCWEYSFFFRMPDFIHNFRAHQVITKSTLEKFKTGTRRSKSLIKLRPVHGRLGNLEVGKENQFLKLDTVHLAELLVHENYNYAFFFCYTFSIFSVFFVFFFAHVLLGLHKVVVSQRRCWLSCVLCSTKLQNCTEKYCPAAVHSLFELGAQNEVSCFVRER